MSLVPCLRLKVQLADSAQGTRSPIKQSKRTSNTNNVRHLTCLGAVLLSKHVKWFLLIFQGESGGRASGQSDELNCQYSSDAPEVNNTTTGKSENWMVLSIAGDKPTPRFNVKNCWYLILGLLYIIIWLKLYVKAILPNWNLYFVFLNSMQQL